jgi:hypothetical protein
LGLYQTDRTTSEDGSATAKEEFLMSIKVKEWLKRLGVETTHEERVEIDLEIESVTKQSCDEGVGKLTEQQFLDIVDKVKRRKRGYERPLVLAETLA